jgi:hypothetical protein
MPPIEQGPGLRGEAPPHGRRGNLPGIVGETADDPHHVSVHRGMRQIEGDARYRRGRVGTGAGKRKQSLIISGRTGRGHLPRGLLQAARPRVVSEAAPHGQDFLLGGAGQRGNIRKALEKPAIIRDHGFHARLLQHDFRDPYAVEGG